MKLIPIVVPVFVVLLRLSRPDHSKGATRIAVCDASGYRSWWPEKPNSNVCTLSQVEQQIHRLLSPAARQSYDSPNSEKIHLIDSIFLIEYSERINKTNLEYFSSALKTIMSASKLTAFSAVDIHSIIVFYSLYGSDLTVLHVQDVNFATRNYFNLSTLIFPDVKEEAAYPTIELDYMAVDRALQFIYSILVGDSLLLMNGNSHAIIPRSFADIHIVTGLGLYKKSVIEDQINIKRTRIASSRKSIEMTISDILDHIQSTSNVALHFFFNHDCYPATEFIGRFRQEVRYRDFTHLNRALTLKSILGTESEASSLQAHILALGKEISVMKLHALNKTDHIVALFPIFWSAFDLQANFNDKCIGISCPSEAYCSPMHGCVNRYLDNSEQGGTANDKVPLSGKFGGNHADLAKKRQASSFNEGSPVEELSIVRDPPPLALPFTLDNIVIGKPRILNWSPDKDFAERFIGKNKPVVLKNSVVSTWSAMKKWSFNYLTQNMGTDMLPLVKSTNNFLTFDPDKTAPLKLNILLPFTESNMTTSSFFACAEQPGSCPDGMKGHYYFGTVPESLQPDLKPDEMLFHTSRDYDAKKQFIWISSAGMITHAHFDQDFNFFVQLIGEKRFTLWPPSQHELMYPYPRVHPLWHKSRVNCRTPDITLFPNFAKTRALQIVLGPGDVLFVPPYTWHYVETLSPSVSLSTWSHDYDLYSHMNAIYKHDHKFDLIKDPQGKRTFHL